MSDDDYNIKPGEYHGKAHHHITKAMYPASSVASWMTQRTWGEVVPDSMLLAASELVFEVERTIDTAEIYYKLLDKKNNGGLTEEEEKQFAEIGNLPTEEEIIAKFTQKMIKNKENIAPSVDGLRASQGHQILVSGGGSVIKKKKRGIKDRILRRKEETEMVPVIRGDE